MGEPVEIGAGVLMRERRSKSRDLNAILGSGLFHPGWVEGDADVIACSTPVSWRSTSTPLEGGGPIRVLPYVVTFRYTVKGKSYEGIINSPDKVQRGDTFTIRYDPRHPEKNNTLDSETNWTYTYTTVFSVVMLLLMTVVFIWSYFFNA
ncbi:MAG: DUF3592 domain-containing protein [Terracidiphilus sp.]